MTDNNAPEDATSTADAQAMYNPLNSVNIDEHDFEEADKEVVFELDDCVVYSIHLECQDDGCDQETIKFAAVGDLPRKPEEAISITHQIYDWFYDNHQNVPMWTEDPVPYVATFVILPTECVPPSKFEHRFSLIVAAAIGFLDGREGQSKKETMEIANLTKNVTERVLSVMPERDLNALVNILSPPLE